jgi:hypothetical protein
MRNIKFGLSLVAAICLASVAMASSEKFRADGTVQRISSDSILVRCSAADIEVNRDAKTKVTGDLRRGSPVTVFYTKVAGQNHADEIIMGGTKAIAPPKSL